MYLEVINSTLQQLAPALAVSGIGLNILFNGFNWFSSKDKDTKELGKTVFVFGGILLTIGLVALGGCCAFLIGVVAVGCGIYFGYGKKAFRKK